MRMRDWTKGSAIMAVVGAAMLFGAPSAAAQSGACPSVTSAGRLGTHVALSALATGLE